MMNVVKKMNEKITLMKPNQKANQIRTQKFVLGRDSPKMLEQLISKKSSIEELRGQQENGKSAEQKSKKRITYTVNGRTLTCERDMEKEIPERVCKNIKQCGNCIGKPITVFIRISEEKMRDPENPEKTIWVEIPEVSNIKELGLCNTHQKRVEKAMVEVSNLYLETRSQRMKEMREVKERLQKLKRFANKLMRSANLESSLPDLSFLNEIQEIKSSYQNTVWKTGKLNYKELVWWKA